jgi:hypothetical protein
MRTTTRSRNLIVAIILALLDIFGRMDKAAGAFAVWRRKRM